MEFEQNWVIVKPETFFPCRTPVLICDNKGNIQIASFIPPEGSARDGYWQCYAYIDSTPSLIPPLSLRVVAADSCGITGIVLSLGSSPGSENHI